MPRDLTTLQATLLGIPRSMALSLPNDEPAAIVTAKTARAQNTPIIPPSFDPEHTA
jgi:hypothetical protein